MKILAMETSSIPASCAVLSNRKILAQSTTHTGLTHSQTLMPMIHDMLKNAALKLDDIDTLAVAVGPGSFTGIRIGVSAIKGLAFARNIPCVGVSTLEAMAVALMPALFSGVICAAMDARRNQLYSACFNCNNGNITRITKDDAAASIDIANRLKQLDTNVLIVGDGAHILMQDCADTKANNVSISPMHLRFQNAVGVALLASNTSKTISAADLRPIYLRPSQAERELLQKNENK